MLSEISEVRLPDIIIYENDMTHLFLFSLHGSKVKSQKNVKWKNISYFEWRLLQCFIKDLEEWWEKNVSWQLVSTFAFANN